MALKSPILKLSLFATGLSGIVAEYMLSTLATYFLGDSVFQWTMIVSVMLFSMGLGSRLSRLFERDLLSKFIQVEFVLSIFVSFSSLAAYLSAGYTAYTGIIIYTLSIIIGILIGLEIPLVIRLNKHFESLKINVSSVMEKDYLGSLVGGVFYAFIGLPLLGLTYTPFLLGAVNFSVAVILFFTVRKQMPAVKRRWGVVSMAVVMALLVTGQLMAKPIIMFGEQKRYKDKVIYSEQTKYQRIVMTQWKEHHWLFINGNQQLSTLDEKMYHEPLVHPAMSLSKTPYQVLILGGGDGCAVREILQYPKVRQVTLVDLDPAMTRLGKTHPVLTALNKDALHHEKVKVLNEDGYHFLEQGMDYYDVIIIDLPDPKSVELNRLYTYEFYQLCRRHLRPKGVLITQAGSPYYATKAFNCIDKTMGAAGFETAKLHNQVLTLGEWGWVIGVPKGRDSLHVALKTRLQNLRFEGLETEWLNSEAMQMMTSFGKEVYFTKDTDPEVNKVHNPVLYRYYLKGNWDLY